MKTKTRRTPKSSLARVRKKLDASLTQVEYAELVHRLAEKELAYLFKHALTQDAAYESLLKHERKRLHRRVALSMEQAYASRLDEHAALLAHHYDQTGDDAKTAEYAIRAGDVATRVFAYPEARAHYALALDAISRLPDNDETRRLRADTLIQQVAVSLRSAGPAETLKRLTEAETLAREFAERAGATRQDRLRLARVYFWQGHALLHHGDARASVQKMQAVMAVAQAEEDSTLLAVSASIIGRSLALRGQIEQAIPILSDAITALEQTHDEHEWIFAVGLRGFCLAMGGEVARGIAEAERTLVRANQVGTLTGIAVAHSIIAMTHLFCDSVSVALEHARAMVETAARSGDRLHAYVGNGYLAWAQTRADQLDEAEKSFAQADAIAQTIGGRLAFSDWFTAGLSELYFRRGEYAQAVALTQEAIEHAQAGGVIFFAGLAHRLRARALAKSTADSWSEIENHLTASLRSFKEGGVRIEMARTHLVWGEISRQRGHANAAREHLESAAAQFQASGLTRELAQVQAVLDKVDTSS